MDMHHGHSQTEFAYWPSSDSPHGDARLSISAEHLIGATGMWHLTASVHLKS
jgi:hypothetical protein